MSWRTRSLFGCNNMKSVFPYLHFYVEKLTLSHRYYYQFREDRLSACPLTVHGLLHVADNIRFCGPVWTTWTFQMERYCGYLQLGIRSKTHPWVNLAKRILHAAYLNQLGARYDLDEELSSVDVKQ